MRYNVPINARLLRSLPLAVAILLSLPVPAIAQNLVMMTYNIRYDNPNDGVNSWGNRLDMLVSQILRQNPDILGIQEGLTHQVLQLRDALPEYEYIGVGRDDGKLAGEYCAIFYKKRRLNADSTGTFWLSPSPEKVSVGWDAALPRICTYGYFTDLSSGANFLVLNTHFDHMGEIARLRSAELICVWIEEKNSSVFLLGDFNCGPESEPLLLLKQDLADSFLDAPDIQPPPHGTYNAFDPNRDASERIDFILYDPGHYKVLKSLILIEPTEGRYPSDHFPAIAEFVYRKGRK